MISHSIRKRGGFLLNFRMFVRVRASEIIIAIIYFLLIYMTGPPYLFSVSLQINK
jgi:hypothetical protein